MKVTALFYVLTDAKGNQTYDVVKESSDNICIGGYDTEGTYHQYDSYEAYYAYGWAEKHGFELEMIEKQLDIQPSVEVQQCGICPNNYIVGTEKVIWGSVKVCSECYCRETEG